MRLIFGLTCLAAALSTACSCSDFISSWDSAGESFADSACADREVRRVPSPGDDWDLVVYLRNCGVGGEGGRFSLVRKGEPFGAEGELGWFVPKYNDVESIGIRWADPSALEITIADRKYGGLQDGSFGRAGATTREISNATIRVTLEEGGLPSAEE